MKRTFTVLIAAFTILCAIAANSRVIENPVYEFKTSGLHHITKIELTEYETRLHIHTIFLPNWWVSFPAEHTYIESDTGERWYATGIINGEFDERIFMPASGDSTFVLIFPPLDKSVYRVNLSTWQSPTIFGISLDPETQPRCREIPDDVLQWIDNELAQARRQTMMNFEAGEFFATDTARLVGYIRGYDRRAGFSMGMIFNSNSITRESNPVVVQIHEDGRFEATIPLSYPIFSSFAFEFLSWDISQVHFYIQPGQTLAILLDWDDFLMSDRLRNAPFRFRNMRFKGAAADINRELSAIQLPPHISNVEGMRRREGRTPSEYKASINEFIADYFENHLRHILENDDISEQTKNLLWNNFLLSHKALLLDLEMSYRDTIPLEFYDFLQNVPMSNKELLSAPQFSRFISGFEHKQLFWGTHREMNRRLTPKISFFEYLFEELNIPKTPEDDFFLALYESAKMRNFSFSSEDLEEMALLEEFIAAYTKLVERYQEYYDAWNRKYVDALLRLSSAEIELERWRMQDSIFTHVLNLEPGIVYDILRVRSLNSRLQNMSVHNKEHNLNLLIGLVGNIPEPFLRQEAARLFIQNLPTAQRQVGEELPDTYAANIFRELIAPFKGKTVLVNFWGTSCGPCIHSIREQKPLRDRYKDSPDVAFVFITSERASPLDRYKEFVKEQELTHSFRIPDNQYNHLMQLFRFMGIPHYVLVDREGRILSDNFRTARFLNFSAPLLPQLLN